MAGKGIKQLFCDDTNNKSMLQHAAYRVTNTCLVIISEKCKFLYTFHNKNIMPLFNA